MSLKYFVGGNKTERQGCVEIINSSSLRVFSTLGKWGRPVSLSGSLYPAIIPFHLSASIAEARALIQNVQVLLQLELPLLPLCNLAQNSKNRGTAYYYACIA